MVSLILLFVLFSSGNSVYGASGNMWSDGELPSPVSPTNVYRLFEFLNSADYKILIRYQA